MIKPSLFRKYFFLAIGVTAFLIILSMIGTFAVTQLQREKFDREPPLFFARLVESISNGDRIAALDRIKNASNATMPIKLFLLDETLRVLYPPNEPSLDLALKHGDLPSEPYVFKRLGPKHQLAPPEGLIRLSGTPAQYLLVRPDFKNGHGPGSGMFLIGFVAPLASALVAVAISIVLIFYSLRQKARLADSVISELKHGNLKARFPIKKLDEVGQTMLRFNHMAEEIERIFENVKSAENARMILLQELAHDLRTPVASMKTLLETLTYSREKLNAGQMEELLQLSIREIEYFERLIEDLLFLAQVSEPTYKTSTESIDLVSLVEDEAESVAASHRKSIELVVENQLNRDSCDMPGDPHLLRRLFRNALENAFSFARSTVTVSFRKNNGSSFEVLIQDDGPGITSGAIASFGHRRTTRKIGEAKNVRLSVGLGSVIMRAVASLHRAEVTISNIDTPGNKSGARLQVLFSKSGFSS